MASGMTIVPVGTARDNVATGELYIRRGNTVSCTVTVTSGATAVNLGGYSAKLQIKNSERTSTLLTFTTSGAAPTIIITSATGKLTFKQTSTVTTALTAQNGVWDWRMTDASGRVQTFARGAAFIIERVTS